MVNIVELFIRLSKRLYSYSYFFFLEILITFYLENNRKNFNFWKKKLCTYTIIAYCKETLYICTGCSKSLSAIDILLWNKYLDLYFIFINCWETFWTPCIWKFLYFLIPQEKVFIKKKLKIIRQGTYTEKLLQLIFSSFQKKSKKIWRLSQNENSVIKKVIFCL